MTAAPPPEQPPRCARCGLDVAAWRVVRGCAVYCSAFCADHAAFSESSRPVEATAKRIATHRIE